MEELLDPQNVVPMLYLNEKSRLLKVGFPFVQAERLELSHLAALDPKSSVSTNSTTPAIRVQIYIFILKQKDFFVKKFIFFVNLSFVQIKLCNK